MSIIEKLENIRLYKEENKHHLLARHLEITSVYMLAFHLRTDKEAGLHEICPLLCVSLTLPFLREAISIAPCLKR